jgi:hypothetical protein
MSTNYDIEIDQGATFTLGVQLYDDNNALIDLTGATARLKIRSGHGVAASLVSVTGSPEIVITANIGKIVVTLSATTTAALTFFKGVYDLEVVLASGTVTRLLEGVVTLNREVTY